MLASTGVGGERNTRRGYIWTCLLGSSLIISWTFRILAHEEDQYTVFLSMALKQTKAGPRSLGTPFLVAIVFIYTPETYAFVYNREYVIHGSKIHIESG